jgi:hypothetical protein
MKCRRQWSDLMTGTRESIVASGGQVFLRLEHDSGLVEEHEISAASGRTLSFETLSPHCRLVFGESAQPLPTEHYAEVRRFTDVDVGRRAREAWKTRLRTATCSADQREIWDALGEIIGGTHS